MIQTYYALCSPTTVYLSATWYTGVRFITDLAGAPGLLLNDWHLHFLSVLHRKTPWQSKGCSLHFMVRHSLAFTYAVFLAQHILPSHFLRPYYFSKLISYQIHSMKSFLTIGNHNNFSFHWSMEQHIIGTIICTRSEVRKLEFEIQAWHLIIVSSYWIALTSLFLSFLPCEASMAVSAGSDCCFNWDMPSRAVL